MTAATTAELRRHVQLPREPASAAEARRQVRATIRDWRIPVDPDLAVLLTSDLVTSVITGGTGPVVGLAISCPGSQLRIGVSDTDWDPWPAKDPAAVPGLPLVAALSASWDCYRTSAGPGAYFTLALKHAPGVHGRRHGPHRRSRSVRRSGAKPARAAGLQPSATAG